ncbi:MAG TPA: extracellular solute-binding protein [Reyranella sp.]|nr:extracellular solute-binding protein [Reyranella sp.]
MAIGRRGIIAGTTALWLGGPSLLQAQPKTYKGMGFAMHGAPKYATPPEHLDYANPAAPKGGSVKFATLGTFDSLHPFTLKGVPATGIGVLWETLCFHADDEPFTVYGLIADSIEVPQDRSWVAFTLRPQAKWNDGTPITVEDVVWSFDTLKAKGPPLYASYYGDVLKAEKTAENTVRFSFRGANNRELPLIISELPVLPSKWWASRDFDKASLEVALSSGPYKVDNYDAGRWISYRRNPDYWGRDLWMNRGRNNFDTIRYDYYRDNDVLFEAFKAGDADIRRENSGRNWMTKYDFPAVKDGRVKREEIPDELPQPMQGFVFNLRKPMFQDRKVREAIGLMYDFEWQNKNLSYGFYKRTRSFFGNSEMEAKGLPSPEELRILEPLKGKIPDEVFTAEYDPPKTDGSGNIREQARKAVALLKDAGYAFDKDGKLIDKQGKRFAFELLLNDAAFERMALPVKQNLERIGIDMAVRTVDTSQYRRRTDNFDFDMIIDLWAQSISPGNEQREFWGSKAADRPGARNMMGLKNPAVDQLVELIIAADDRESLVTRCKCLDRVLQWIEFVIPQFYSDKELVAYWNRFAHPATPPKYNPLVFEIWWVDETKDKSLQKAQKT